MLDSHYRSPYQKYLIYPIVKSRWISFVSPSFITFLSLLSGIFVPIFLYFDRSLFAFFFLVLSGFFDTLDGSLAREKQSSSPRGALLDIMADRTVEFLVILALFLVDIDQRGLLALGMLGASYLCVTSFLVVGIFTQNSSEKSFYYSAGIMERTEAFFFFSLMILFPKIFTLLALTYITLVTLTAFIRAFQFLRQN